MLRVLYFHGFASSPKSAKITALRPLLEPLGIELVTPDLNVPDFEHLSWAAMGQRAFEAGRECNPGAIVGSSLGSLVALEVVRRGLRRPLVLIAPAIGVGRRWLVRLQAGDPVTVFNYALDADAQIHRAFFEEMNQVTVDHDPPAVPVTVLMGRQDQSVPFEIVAERWTEWLAAGLQPRSKFIDIADGDHGLTAYTDLIAREIVAATEVASGR